MATNSDGGEDGPHWVTNSNGATPDAYHATRDCPRVQQPDKYRDRDPSYIEFHGLEECSFCHDDPPEDGGEGAWAGQTI